MGAWPSSSSDPLLRALSLAALLWAQPAAQAAPPDAGAPARATEGGGRIDDRNLLRVSFEAPSGWTPTQLPSVIKLYSQSPPGLVIRLAYYQPHNEAQYQSWTRWTEEKLRLRSAAATVRRRHPLVVGGQKALQFEWAEKG